LGEKSVDYELQGVRPTDRPMKTWSKVTEKDCQTRQLHKEDAMDRKKWRKLINGVV